LTVLVLYFLIICSGRGSLDEQVLSRESVHVLDSCLRDKRQHEKTNDEWRHQFKYDQSPVGNLAAVNAAWAHFSELDAVEALAMRPSKEKLLHRKEYE